MARQKVVGGAGNRGQHLHGRFRHNEAAISYERRWGIEAEGLQGQQGFEADQRRGWQEENFLSLHGHKIESEKCLNCFLVLKVINF